MQSLYGVKGLSALHILPSFDVVNGTVIDYMHCVLEGVVKKLLNLWFSAVGQPYYIKRHTPTVNTRLLGIKPPNTITRTPRGLDQACKWKGINIVCLSLCITVHTNIHALNFTYEFPAASEYRAWLLFYSIPVLSGLLPPCYHKHLQYLVCSLHILLSDCITPADLTLAENMFEVFCRNFEKLHSINPRAHAQRELL